MQILSTEHFAIFPLAASRDLGEVPLDKGEVLISDEVARAVFSHKIKMEDVVICVQRNGNPDMLLEPPPAPAPAPAPAAVPETVSVPIEVPEVPAAPAAPAAKKRGKAAKGDGDDVFGLGAGQEAK